LVADANDVPVPTLYLRRDRGKINVGEPKKNKAQGLDLIEEVDLSKKLKLTDVSDLLKNEKWTEQILGLQQIIDAIGPTPKLKPHSFIQDLTKFCKEFITNGHLQVQSKSLRLISILSVALKNKFATDSRTILPFIIAKSKEKKIVDEVEETCVNLFKNSVNVDPFVEDLTEILKNKRSPPHSKSCMMQIIVSLVKNEDFAMGSENTRLLVESVVFCHDDSDPKVRESSITTLAVLQQVSQQRNSTLCKDIFGALNAIKNSNPKLFSRLTTDSSKGINQEAVAKSSELKTIKNSRPVAKAVVQESLKESSVPKAVTVVQEKEKGKKFSKREESSLDSYPFGFNLADISNVPVETQEVVISEILNEDINLLTKMLTDIKWQSKVDALTKLTTAVSMKETLEDVQVNSIFLYLARASGNFKANNVNVSKGFVDVLFEVASKTTGAKPFFCAAMDALADKFSEKKIVPSLEMFLQCAVVVLGVNNVFERMNNILVNVKAPLVHLNYLTWMKTTVTSKGIRMTNLSNILPYVFKCIENKQSNIRTAALETTCEIYRFIGPTVISILNSSELPQNMKTLVETECQKVGFSPENMKAVNGDSKGDCLRVDLSTVLDKNILNDLSCIDGKDSWQQRKSAMEKIMNSCDSCGNYIEINKFSLELLRALKPRLSDTQSNLRPIALSTFAKLIVAGDEEGAIKALKFLLPSVLNCLSDSKKNIKDSAIVAIEGILSHFKNKKSAFTVIIASITEWLPASTSKGDILVWLQSHSDLLDGDCIEIVGPLIEAFQDKSSAVRSSAEGIISHLFQQNFVTMNMIEKATRDFSTASKKSIQPILDRIFRVVPKSFAKSQVSDSQERILTANTAVEEELTTAIELPSLLTTKSTRMKSINDIGSMPNVIQQLKNDWFGGADSPLSNCIFDPVQIPAAGKQILILLQDESFIQQTDLIFRWFGCQLLMSDHENTVDSLLHEFTLLLDGVRSLPRIMKQQLDPNEAGLFLPSLLFNSRNFLPKFKQHYQSILNCTSDCFPAHAIAEHLLRGFSLDSEDTRKLCMHEIIRLTESVGYSAFNRTGMKILIQKLQTTQSGDSDFFEIRQLVNALLDSINGDKNKLKYLYGEDFDDAVFDKFEIALDITEPCEPINVDIASIIKELATLPESQNYSEETLQRLIVFINDGQLNFELHDSLIDILGIFIKFLQSDITSIQYQPLQKCLIICLLTISKLIIKTGIYHSDVEKSSVVLTMMFNIAHKLNGRSSVHFFELAIQNLIMQIIFEMDIQPLLLVSVRILPNLQDKRPLIKTLGKLIEKRLYNIDKSGLDLNVAVEVIRQCEAYMLVDSQIQQSGELHLTFIKLLYIIMSEIFGDLPLRELLYNYGKNSAIIYDGQLFTDDKQSAPDNRIISLINDLTISRDKSLSIRELHRLKNLHPTLEIDRYLQKLSSTFRKYVYDEFAKLDSEVGLATENIENKCDDQLSDTSTTAAFKILENLKTLPLTQPPNDDDAANMIDNEIRTER
jgi:regulator of RNase E activity RraB